MADQVIIEETHYLTIREEGENQIVIAHESAQGPPGTGGGGITDGDKGDIVVSGTGAAWTIDPALLTTFMRTVTAAANAGAARTVLGLAIGSDVQAYSAVLAATTASFLTAHATKLGHITVTQAVDLDAIETRVNALDAAVVLKGTWDASAGTFPGSGTAQAGDSWIVSVAGTVNSVAFAVGDRIIAITDNASTSTYASNWFKADYTDQVLSVAGKSGAVTLQVADLTDMSANGRSLVSASNYAAMLALLLPADLLIPTVLTVPNTGLHLLDTNASHDLIIKPGSNITADRTFTVTTGDTDIEIDLSDAGADKLMFWDDSASKWTALTPGANLTITGTTIDAASGGMTVATPLATTSGTSKDFTVTGAKQVTVTFNGVSLSAGVLLIQLGDAGGIETSGYAAAATSVTANATAANVAFVNTSAAGFPVGGGSGGGLVYYGSITFTLHDSTNNTWVAGGSIYVDGSGTAYVGNAGGRKSTSQPLTTVRVTSVSGSDTFDLGAVGVTYQ